MNLANIVKKLHMRKDRRDGLLKRVADDDAAIKLLEEQISCHVDTPKNGAFPTVISLRYGMFGRKTYYLHANGSTTRCTLIEERR